MELVCNRNDKLLRNLFEQAKKKSDISEWEFIQTIMRDNLTSNNYTADNIIDCPEIYEHLKGFKDGIQFERQIRDENIDYAYNLCIIGNSFKDDYDKFIRMRLLAYCYIIEMSYLLNIVINLLWIANGQRFFPKPFEKDVLKEFLNNEEINTICSTGKKEIATTKDKYLLIQLLCDKTGNSELGVYMNSFYDNHIRNSFYHSRYLIGKNGYIGFDKSKTIVMNKEEIGIKIDKAIFFFDALIKLLEEYRKSYNHSIDIRGLEMNYNSNNLSNSKVIDIKIVANNRLGIVSTIEHLDRSNCSSNNKEDDGFFEEYVKFAEDYDLLLKEKIENE